MIPVAFTRLHKLDENPNKPLSFSGMNQEFFDDLIYYIEAQEKGPWKEQGIDVDKIIKICTRGNNQNVVLGKIYELTQSLG